jgi:hypothetical protein
VAVLISALVAAVNPALWPWVAVTIGVIVLAQLGGVALRALKAHGSAARVASIGAAGLAVLATLSTLVMVSRNGDQNAGDGGDGEPPTVSLFLELPVDYSATAHYLAGGGEALRLEERLTLTSEALDAGAEDLHAAARQAGDRAQEDEEERLLEHFPEREAVVVSNDLRTQPGLRDELDLPPAREAFRLAAPDLAAARRRLSAALARGLRDGGWDLDGASTSEWVRGLPRRLRDRFRGSTGIPGARRRRA